MLEPRFKISVLAVLVQPTSSLPWVRKQIFRLSQDGRALAPRECAALATRIQEAVSAGHKITTAVQTAEVCVFIGVVDAELAVLAFDV